MTRENCIAATTAYFDDGDFLADCGRLVAIPSESQKAEGLVHCLRYLDEAMIPAFKTMGFTTKTYENPVTGYGPVLLATRVEDPTLPTILGYGHGDVIRGMADQWTKGAGPWKVAVDGERLYGRGTADNKSQHWINMVAMRYVLENRGKLGFNAKFLIETGEENGSRGLGEVIKSNMDDFGADVFIASDGPRVRRDLPTLFLGSRGATNFDLVCSLRESGHHSGNWGGALADPAVILAHAIGCISGRHGRIEVEAWRPPELTDATREMLRSVVLDAGPDGPIADPVWGEPGFSPAENVHAWNAFSVLAMTSGNPTSPVNAIAPSARAHCQLRYIADTDATAILPALRKHLDDHGFEMVRIEEPPAENRGGFAASRTEPENPWVVAVCQSMERSTGSQPVVIPQMGGSICNELFTDLLGLPAIWIPHSYSGCSQHAPNEHILMPLCREALQIMAGLYWDLGEEKT